MKDYRVPVEFTAVLVRPENYGEPGMASISDQDVRTWAGGLTFSELVDEESTFDYAALWRLVPGVYRIKCTTRCRIDEVFIDILEVTKQ